MSIGGIKLNEEEAVHNEGSVVNALRIIGYLQFLIGIIVAIQQPTWISLITWGGVFLFFGALLVGLAEVLYFVRKQALNIR